MPRRPPPLRVLLPLLVLDLAGMALAGLGLAAQLGGMALLPERWQFPYHGWVLLAAGVALMLPLPRLLLRHARNPAAVEPGIEA